MTATTTTQIPANWPTARTADGVLIKPGMIARNNNMEPCVVTDTEPLIENGVAWFYTTAGIFDGSRLTFIA